MSTSNVRPADMERITTPALAQKYIDEQIKELRAQIGDKKVLLALSGGVDSSVVAALLIKAVGKQLVSVHVNHGLLRKGEPEQVIKVFRDELNANLVYVDATDRFLNKLAGVADPEQKRKIIGAEFIRVFEEEARKLEGISFLAQGTIYPDIVESGPVKSHHNVGGLPEDMQFELVEPIKLLFKDEVRVVGKELGLPDNMVYRQPFPGPGLGVRCTGAITRDRLEALRESDAILREEFAKNGLEGKVWQYFTIVPDYKSTGVKDNKRSWDWPVIIRAVNTRDAMTATIEEIPYPLLHHIITKMQGFSPAFLVIVSSSASALAMPCTSLSPALRDSRGRPHRRYRNSPSPPHTADASRWCAATAGLHPSASDKTCRRRSVRISSRRNKYHSHQTSFWPLSPPPHHTGQRYTVQSPNYLPYFVL